MPTTVETVRASGAPLVRVEGVLVRVRVRVLVRVLGRVLGRVEGVPLRVRGVLLRVGGVLLRVVGLVLVPVHGRALRNGSAACAGEVTQWNSTAAVPLLLSVTVRKALISLDPPENSKLSLSSDTVSSGGSTSPSQLILPECMPLTT